MPEATSALIEGRGGASQNHPIMPPPSDPLGPLFERGRAAAPPLGNSVAPEVWRRLRATPAAGGDPGWWGRVAGLCAPPAFAFAFVAACLLGGLFLAELRLSRLQAERSAQLARSYVRLIAPLLENTPPAGRAEGALP